jgi:Amt family ammonium transporter
MSFVMIAMISVLWAFYGYSLSFGPDLQGLIGRLDWVGLMNVGQSPSTVYATTIPHLVFMMFQATFAIITVALITGGVVERIKFSSLLVFSIVWFTIVYCPIAHWVWGNNGWMARLGVLDFAGGTVVHINAGFAALALAIVLGPRKGFKEKEIMNPNNIPFVVLGTGLLWIGWFGFNAGSALTASGSAASALAATNLAGAAAALTWMTLGWIYRRPSVLGIATGAVVGLATVTPAAGFIQPIAAVPIGIVSAIVSYYIMLWRSKTNKIDESLDVFACHGIGGIIGVLATGIFAVSAVGGKSGLIEGNGTQMLIQLLAVVVTVGFSFAVSWLIAKVVQVTMGLRVNEYEELVGLDVSQHGENAYGSLV